MTVSYTKIADGNWNNPSTWSPSGVPGEEDNVTIGDGALSIPDSYTARALSVTTLGSSVSARAILTVAGLLEIYGDSNQGTWTTLNFIGNGSLDVRGNSWLIDQSDAYFGVRNIVQNDGTGMTRIFSSTTKGYFGGADGGVTGGLLDLDRFWIANVDWRYGANYFANNHFRLSQGVFYRCGKLDWSDYQEDTADFILDGVHFVDSQAPDEYKAFIMCRSTTGEPTAARIINNVVFDYTGLPNAIVRGRYWPANMSVIGLYVVGAYFEGLSIACGINKMFSAKVGVVGEGGMPLFRSYFAPNVNNPHTLTNMCEDVDTCIIESIQPSDSTDAGDHAIVVASGSNILRRTILIDNWGGVLLNALGGPNKTGTYVLEHCTAVYDVHDPVYGQLVRNENFGIFDESSDVTILSNIAYVRSNPSGAPNIRVFNLETAGDDQIKTIDNNVFFGQGTDLATIYHGVESAIKGPIGSQAGWGQNDKINVDPKFVDHNRGIVKWGQRFGATDYDTAVAFLCNGINGYDPDTHMLDPNLKTGKTLDDLFDYVADGFKPKNIVLKNAGHDGVTIGAAEFQEDSGGDDTVSSLVAIKTINIRAMSIRSMGAA